MYTVYTISPNFVYIVYTKSHKFVYTVHAHEVKSARNVTAKSLARFVREGRSPVAYRLSERDFGVDVVSGTDAPLHSLPLYAAFAIK
ncbi:ATPase [Bifidobacterium lemurum]|uniref:ATPase n=1 Tax=Bifidobacterium lemurum TaxID=1603886 RepID=A0A261FSQ2_9BIFI|nr:ATPase [Bifidobacterium lemurum]